MLKATILPLLALLATATATTPHPTKSNALALLPRDLAAREPAGLDSEECMNALSALLPLATSIPTPPPDLAEKLATVTITDACEMPTGIDSDVEEGLSKYTSALVDWYGTHSADIQSALSECPDFTTYLSDSPVCTDDVMNHLDGEEGGAKATGGAGGEAEAQEDGHDHDEDGFEQGGDESGAAHVNDAMVAATAAFAGFLLFTASL